MKFKTVKIGDTDHPVMFGMSALERIAEKVGNDPTDFFGSLSANTLSNRIDIAHIGLLEGQRLAGTSGIPSDRVAFCDMLDYRPAVLEEVISVYYLQTFGEKIEKLIKDAEAVENQEVNEAVEQVKNVWPMLTETANGLASVEFTK